MQRNLNSKLFRCSKSHSILSPVVRGKFRGLKFLRANSHLSSGLSGSLLICTGNVLRVQSRGMSGVSWKDGQFQFGLNMDQSVKKGVPIPNITEDLACWHSVLGRRVVNEDRVDVCSFEHHNCLYMALFDGHASPHAVDFMQASVRSHLQSWLNYNRNIQVCLKQTFVDVNNLYSRSLWSALMRLGSEPQEREHLENSLKSGTTAVVAVLRNSQELVVGAVGDSSAVLCRGGVAHPLNEHHTPAVHSEQTRIHSRGGFIASNSIGQLLVNARLSMTRSLGDLQLHCHGVIPVPSTKSIEIKHHKDQFLLLVTDGISQVLSEQEMVNIVLNCAHPRDACRLLTEIALQYGSDDNSTALVVPLGAWGKNDSIIARKKAVTSSNSWQNMCKIIGRRD